MAKSEEEKALEAQAKADEKAKKEAEKASKNTVEVDAEVLERLLKTVESQGKKIEILTEVADKNRLTRVEEMRAQGKLVKKVGLNTYEGKIVIAEKSVKNDVYTDQHGIMHEDQTVALYFLGEKEVGPEINIRSRTRLLKRIECEVLEEGKDKDGNINFTVQTPDGREIKIDSKFIN